MIPRPIPCNGLLVVLELHMELSMVSGAFVRNMRASAYYLKILRALSE